METICKIVKSDMVVVGFDFDLREIRKKYDLYKLYLSENNNPSTYMVGFVNRKSLNKTIKRKFTQLIKTIYSNGIYDINQRHLTDFHVMMNNFECQCEYTCTFKQNENVNHINLNMNQLRFIFYVLYFGLTLSTYFMIIENLYKCFSINL